VVKLDATGFVLKHIFEISRTQTPSLSEVLLSKWSRGYRSLRTFVRY